MKELEALAAEQSATLRVQTYTHDGNRYAFASFAWPLEQRKRGQTVVNAEAGSLDECVAKLAEKVAKKLA